MRGDQMDGAPRDRLERWLERVDPAWIGAAFVMLALAVYIASNPERQNFYNHFVWQADAWLHGSAAIRYPVSTGPVTNDYFQDVLPLADRPGYALIPFPPMPAVVLLPFVALWGLTTNAALIGAVLGAVNVGLCWRMLMRVTDRRSAAVLGTIFYAFGTVAWYAAMLASTWFLAHVVASTFLLLGITAALDAERRGGRARAGAPTSSSSWTTGYFAPIDWRQLAAGVLFGMAALARLTTVFGAPFFLFVGGGGTWPRRALSAAIGAAIPLCLLLAYNVATTGEFFSPAYAYIRQNEYRPKPEFYHPDWAIEDPRYVLQNAQILLLWPPEQPSATNTDCASATSGRSLLDTIFDPDCAPVRPDPLGMSIILVSPAYLLGLVPLLTSWRRRLVAGSALAVLAIALVNLAHFSQGWVQFGYRFSNDFAPYGIILVTLGIARLRAGTATTALAASLVGLSVLVNAWGVAWGVILGW